MAYEELIAARLRQKSFINGTDLSKLSDVEIDVFIALADLLNRFPHTGVRASQVINHELLKKVSRATIFRALKALEAAEIVQKQGTRSGYYFVVLSE